jgi:thiosulfate/3-mercaptopyruvate sulfurtransferase
MKLTPIIQVSELIKLHKAENLVIIDASNGKDAKSNYDQKHLEDAIFVDLNVQLAHIKEDLSDGGRHPLPKIEDFAITLLNLGITKNSHVVVYDDKNGANAAARFWWMLKSVGHEKVQVLNGGFQEAVKQNFPITSTITSINKADLYKIKDWKLHIASITDVEEKSKNNTGLIIDVRESKRFNGETEPIDLIAGHIPGATNVPFTENLDENGLFLSPKELKNKYKNTFGNCESENIIVHCGSGVTACHTLLAIDYAEIEIPKLYVGSWSEWSRNNNLMITK